jgi:hypothetical protein
MMVDFHVGFFSQFFLRDQVMFLGLFGLTVAAGHVKFRRNIGNSTADLTQRFRIMCDRNFPVRD